MQPVKHCHHVIAAPRKVLSLCYLARPDQLQHFVAAADRFEEMNRPARLEPDGPPMECFFLRAYRRRTSSIHPSLAHEVVEPLRSGFVDDQEESQRIPA
jgi:hypothetical protein